MKTTVADGVPVQLPEKSIPDAASLEPPSSSGGPPPQGHVPYQATKNRGQPPARHEGAWASNFFKQRASAFQPGRGAQPSPRSRISTVMVSVRRHNTCRGVKLAASKLIRWSPCAFVWARLLFFWGPAGQVFPECNNEDDHSQRKPRTLPGYIYLAVARPSPGCCAQYATWSGSERSRSSSIAAAGARSCSRR